MSDSLPQPLLHDLTGAPVYEGDLVVLLYADRLRTGRLLGLPVLGIQFDTPCESGATTLSIGYYPVPQFVEEHLLTKIAEAVPLFFVDLTTLPEPQELFPSNPAEGNVPAQLYPEFVLEVESMTDRREQLEVEFKQADFPHTSYSRLITKCKDGLADLSPGDKVLFEVRKVQNA